MSQTQVSNGTVAEAVRPAAVPMRLEVVVIPVSDVERAKAFYERLGWRNDGEGGEGDYSIVQLTPPGSAASIIFGKGITGTPPGSVDRLLLAVDDMEVARQDLIARGVEVSEPFHHAGGGLDGGFHRNPEERAPGFDPEGRSYASYATFSDPDGNVWLLQEITDRLPGRV